MLDSSPDPLAVPEKEQLFLSLTNDEKERQSPSFKEGCRECFQLGFQLGIQRAQAVTRQLYRDMALRSIERQFPDLMSRFQACLDEIDDFIPFGRLCVDITFCRTLEEAQRALRDARASQPGNQEPMKC